MITENVLCAAVTLMLGVFFKVRLGERGRWGWLGVAMLGLLGISLKAVRPACVPGSR